MAVKKGKAPTRSTEVVPREYASQEGADVDLAPAALTSAQIAQRRRDRARAEAAGVLGPLRPEELDIARDVDVDADEDERRKRKAWEKKKREMAREKAARMARKGKIPPMSDHLEQVIQDIFSEADEREPVDSGTPLSPMEDFANRQADWDEVSDLYRAEQGKNWRGMLADHHRDHIGRIDASDLGVMEELNLAIQEAAEYPPHSSEITQEVTDDAREEVEREFMEDYPDLEDTALAVGSADDSAPLFAAAIDTATDINEEARSDGKTEITFTDKHGTEQRWVYDGEDDTLTSVTGL